MSGKIQRVAKTIHDYGCFHDAVITKVEFDFLLRTVRVHLDDLNSNFLDTDEYLGLNPGVLSFSDVVASSAKDLFGSKPDILDMKLEEITDGALALTIFCSAGRRIEVQMGEMEIESGA